MGTKWKILNGQKLRTTNSPRKNSSSRLFRVFKCRLNSKTECQVLRRELGFYRNLKLCLRLNFFYWYKEGSARADFELFFKNSANFHLSFNCRYVQFHNPMTHSNDKYHEKDVLLGSNCHH